MGKDGRWTLGALEKDLDELDRGVCMVQLVSFMGKEQEYLENLAQAGEDPQVLHALQFARAYGGMPRPRGRGAVGGAKSVLVALKVVY